MPFFHRSEPRRRWRNRGASRWPWVVGLGGAALVLLIASTQTCLRVGFSKGLWLNECPDGELRQTISVNTGALTRGAVAMVNVSVNALFTTGSADQQRVVPVHSFTPTVALVAADKETLLVPLKWERRGETLAGDIALPKVNDGEYTLRVRATSTIGESVLDLPLSLYTPARVHLITDRPLYEPGNTVKFRALALKASDLTPLEERPGVWTVIDPSGEVLLEEKAPSGKWGVVAGSFPIDLGATSGEWRVVWASGGMSETRTFTVKPFTLPRFRIEAATAKPFYRRHERPVLRGTVKYSSGAPVPAAKVEFTWNTAGQWPAPTSWTNGTALPKVATTSPTGQFSVELPEVPDDLQGQASLNAALSVVDKAGDRVEGGASVQLSEDLIQVTPVTELASGLVEGFNNRLFLRASSADGRVLDGVTLTVKRLWEPTDKGTDAHADEDGVASLQLDPGPAVNVIVPAMPFRPPPPTKVVRRASLQNLLARDDEDSDVTLADRISFDRLEPKLERCARYSHGGGETLTVGVFVHAPGTQGLSAIPHSKLGECVASVLREAKFEPGHERLFNAQWTFDDSDLPHFQVTIEGVPEAPDELAGLIDEALLDARDCLPATVRSGSLPKLLQWRIPGEGRKVELAWVPVKGDRYADAEVSCITSRIAALSLPPIGPNAEAEPREAAVGVARVSISAPEKYESQRPQETVMTGYEFLVSAKKGKELLGSTKLRMAPGAIPQIRLRASSQLVDPGATVTVEILRGPDFKGELPDELFLNHAYQHVKAKVDKENRQAQFIVPTDWQGWAQVAWGGGQVFFFVRSTTPVAVSLSPDKPRYAPGQVAQLGIETTVGGKPSEAAVGLIGVDDSLGQLVALPGADELSSVRAQPTQAVAFAGIDAQALSLGRVRGANAAAATLLRVSALPPPPQIEAAVPVSGQTAFDANEVLVDRFYVALGELSNQVREWEGSAPSAEKMSNATMARLWKTSLEALERRKEPARDAWGRALRLHRLPMDLLALTEPRSLVINGTRLPEDMPNWSQWVAKEKP